MDPGIFGIRVQPIDHPAAPPCPLLRLGPTRGDHDRDLGDAELPGGEHASMAGDQATVLAHQRRRRPAPFLDARGYRGMTACFIMARQNECTRDEIQNLAREFLAGWLIDPAE